MIILGVDPGLDGAVAFLDTESPALRVEDMPTFQVSRGGKAKRDLDPHTLAAWLEATRPGHAFVEQVGAMPGMGVSGAFAFGKGYGIVIGVLVASGVPMTRVAPLAWKKALRVPAEKDAARQRASELMPGFAFHWPLKKHDGRAESALIAYYGRQTLHAVARAA